MSRIFPGSAEAVADIPSGAAILIAGFGICGMPHNLCKALSERSGVDDLRIVGTLDPEWLRERR